MKKAIYRFIVLAILVGGAWYGYHYYKQRPEKASLIATAKVQRGDVVIRAFTRGQLNAVRVYPLYSPNLNGTVQVTALASMGSLAKEKDLIVEYDDSELLASIDGDKLNVDSTDESIKAQQLNMDITRSRDKVSLLSAQYSVKRADLNVQQNEVIDVIDQKKNTLKQEQANRTLAQQQVDNEMREKQLDSQLQVFQAARQRSATELLRDQARLLDTKTLAPMSGMVAVKQNRGGNFNFGMQMPDIRQGDELQAGMNVADLLDLSEMNLSAKIGELDRANLKEGQEMTFQLDSVPDKRFPGKIKTLSGTATSDVFSGDPSKKFDITFSIDMRAMLTGLGMKPADVDRIMNDAAKNASKNLVSFAPTGGGGRGGGGPGGGGPGGPGGPPGMDLGGAFDPSMIAAMVAAQGGQAGRGGAQASAPGGAQASGPGGAQARGPGGAQAGGQGRGQGRGQGGSTPTLSAADRQKLAEIGKQLLTATGDERDKLQAQFQQLMPQAAPRQGRGGQGGQARGQRGGDAAGGQGRGQGGSGGGQGRQFGMAAASPFTNEDRANAKLPRPPDQDADVAKLLRPGLLADVEIEVEKIPNAIHVPLQAVITKDGQPTVYVLQANGKFAARVVKVLKRSESIMVLESGVEPGELVALADPTASKSEKNKTEDTKKGASATSMMPGGK